MTAAVTTPPAVSDEQAHRLRRFNLVMGVIHLLSGAAMWVIGNGFELVDVGQQRMSALFKNRKG